jgi:hypothetical protein
MKFLQQSILLVAAALAVVVDSAAASSSSSPTSPRTTFPTMRAVKRPASLALNKKDTFYSAAATSSASSPTTNEELNVQVFECDNELKELAGPKKIQGTIVRLCFRPNAQKQQQQQEAAASRNDNDEVCSAGSYAWQWEMEYKKGWVWEMEYKNGWAERKAVMDGSSTSQNGDGDRPLLSLMECVVDQGKVCYLDTILSSGFHEPTKEGAVMGKGWASLTAIASPIVFKYKYYKSGKKKGRNGKENNVCSS